MIQRRRRQQTIQFQMVLVFLLVKHLMVQQ